MRDIEVENWTRYFQNTKKEWYVYLCHDIHPFIQSFFFCHRLSFMRVDGRKVCNLPCLPTMFPFKFIANSFMSPWRLPVSDRTILFWIIPQVSFFWVLILKTLLFILALPIPSTRRKAYTHSLSLYKLRILTFLKIWFLPATLLFLKAYCLLMWRRVVWQTGISASDQRATPFLFYSEDGHGSSLPNVGIYELTRRNMPRQQSS